MSARASDSRRLPAIGALRQCPPPTPAGVGAPRPRARRESDANRWLSVRESEMRRSDSRPPARPESASPVGGSGPARRPGTASAAAALPPRRRVLPPSAPPPRARRREAPSAGFLSSRPSRTPRGGPQAGFRHGDRGARTGPSASLLGGASEGRLISPRACTLSFQREVSARESDRLEASPTPSRRRRDRADGETADTQRPASADPGGLTPDPAKLLPRTAISVLGSRTRRIARDGLRARRRGLGSAEPASASPAGSAPPSATRIPDRGLDPRA